MTDNNYPPLPQAADEEPQTLTYYYTGSQMRAYIDADRAQRKPLTDEQVAQATGSKQGQPLFLAALGFARAIEAAHGINPPPRPDAGNN